MTKPRDPDALLSAFLAGGMEVLPDRVVDSVLEEIHRTRQRAVFGPSRIRSMSGAIGAAAVVAVLVVGGAFYVTQRGQPGVGGPSPTPSASPSPTLGASASPGQPTAAPTAKVSPSAAGQGPVLTWTKLALDERSLRLPGPGADDRTTTRVAWLGDRFVLVDEDAGAVSTSIDGASWHVLQPGDPDPGYFDLLLGTFASWRDDIVGWNPSGNGVRVVRPPAQPTTKGDFKGNVGEVGIGPAGIVAHVHSAIDFDAYVTSVLGPGWVEHMVTFSYEDGILRITTDDKRNLEVVWADQGFEPGDVADRGFGWYSPDGDRWTAIPSFPANVSEIVGVSDGFIARAGGARCDGCKNAEAGGIWHSSDGLTWRYLGAPKGWGDGSLLPWMGGAIVTDGKGQFDAWTAEVKRALPMGAELPDTSGKSVASIGTGSLGIVSVRFDDREILYSKDGVDWSIVAMPDEMAKGGSGGGRTATTVVVGDRSVVILVWTGSREAPVPTLWRGTIKP